MSESTPAENAGLSSRTAHSSRPARRAARPLDDRAGSPSLLRNVIKRRDDRATPWYQTGLGALAVVLAVIVAGAWALKRWVPAARVGGGNIIRLVARISLSSKQSVVLLHVGHRLVMVGLSGDRVSPLCEITDPDEVAQLLVRAGVSSGRGAVGFDDLLLREEADYHEAGEPVIGTTASRLTENHGTRQPLKNLIQRLRVLQTQ